MTGSALPTLWVVVGATGTGKSDAALELVETRREAGVTAEVVNADAMQLYRGMNIGTAKLSLAERRGITHHLFDVVEPADEASVAWYQPVARSTIESVMHRGNDAVLVGGSGLYVSSVIYDFTFPPRDEQLRGALEAEADAGGAAAVASMLERLRAIDPGAAAAVDARNPRRVVRALEVALLGGSAQVTLPTAPTLWRPRTRIIGMRVPREELVARLDARVRRMWAAGMLDEVRALMPQGLEHGKTASRAIGYAQALAQLRGELSEADAIAETQRLTRRYARRQVSWFKRYADVTWVDAAASSAGMGTASSADADAGLGAGGDQGLGASAGAEASPTVGLPAHTRAAIAAAAARSGPLS